MNSETFRRTAGFDGTGLSQNTAGTGVSDLALKGSEQHA